MITNLRERERKDCQEILLPSFFWISTRYENTRRETEIEERDLPLRFLIWATAILSMVYLSGFLASAEHVGTMSDNSVM